jgi:hypothetical protein
LRNRLTPLTLTLLLLASACAPARLSQFRSFSQAGVSYVKASEAFLDEAGAAAIKGDTTLLLRARPDLTEAERRKQLLANNRLLRERLLLLNQLKTHGNLLREYFEILGLLADSKAPAPLTASAQNVFAGLSKLAPSLRSASLGGVSIESRLPAVLNLAVAPFKSRALENELKERGPAIERELALQEAALSLLSEELRKDLTILANAVETRDLVTPFASAPDVPSNWPARRAEILHSQVTSESATAAALAAAKLRAAFQRLASNQLDPAALSSLTAEISALVNLTGAIKAAGANP